MSEVQAWEVQVSVALAWEVQGMVLEARELVLNNEKASQHETQITETQLRAQIVYKDSHVVVMIEQRSCASAKL